MIHHHHHRRPLCPVFRLPLHLLLPWQFPGYPTSPPRVYTNMYVMIKLHTATHCNTLQHTATLCYTYVIIKLHILECLECRHHLKYRTWCFVHNHGKRHVRQWIWQKNTCKNLCIYQSMFIYIYAYIYIYLHSHTYDTHTHTYMCTCLSMLRMSHTMGCLPLSPPSLPPSLSLARSLPLFLSHSLALSPSFSRARARTYKLRALSELQRVAVCCSVI